MHAVRPIALHAAAVAALLALSPWLTSPAVAQTIELDTAPAVRCLMPAEAQRGEPEYPFDAWKLGEKGRVVVDLVFAAADRRPVMNVIESEGGREFVDAVRRHVATLRVPCLADIAGGTTTLRQTYLFQPDQRKVYWSEPTDGGESRRLEQSSCMVHSSGAKAPNYPSSAQLNQIQGRVVARMTFFAPDQPPKIEAYSRKVSAILARYIRQWSQGLRLPCLEGPEPLNLHLTYVFRFEGDEAYGLKPLELVDLLSAVKDVQSQTIQFDTTQMGCPFDLKFQYLQPHLPNGVGEVGESRPERRALRAWLAAQELDVPSRSLDAIYGDNTTITVPCVKLNIQPTEKKP